MNTKAAFKKNSVDNIEVIQEKSYNNNTYLFFA